MMLPVAFVLVGLLSLVASQRNAKEEAICAPFLTSPSSSPLVEGLQRNLKYDEDAEFSCELVLQDRFLPAQIRLTVHEGLYFLAVRHIQMGMSRQRTAARHAKHLAAMVPDNFRFQFYLGTWSIHPEVADAETAATALHECLYGNASRDSTTTAKERFHARKDYISALLALGRQEEAIQETEKVLQTNPFEFSLAAMWKSYKIAAGEDPMASEWFPKEVYELEEAIYARRDLHTVSYPEHNHCESVPESGQTIHTMDHMMSPEEFESFSRLPIKIEAGSIQAISEALHWHVHDRWYEPNSNRINFQYFKERVSEEEDVLVESNTFEHCDNDLLESDLSLVTPDDYDRPCVAFGLSIGARRSTMLFHKLLDQQLQSLDTLESIYINVQDPRSGKFPFRTPLHFFEDDLSITEDDTIFRFIRNNLTDINLWMSNTRLQSATAPHPHLRPTASRLHRDAVDNLYIVLEGEKRFDLWHPCHFKEIRTLSPSFHVNKDGLPTQFNVNALKGYFRTYVDQQWEARRSVHQTSAAAQNSSSQQDMQQRKDVHESEQYEAFLNEFHPLLRKLLAPAEEDVRYDLKNLHFSQKSWHTTASVPKELPPPTITVTIKPGDILYLPTGWFHEVSSMPGRQVALNIWSKPPHWETAFHDETVAHQRLMEGLVEHFQSLHAATTSSVLASKQSAHNEL